MKNTSISSLSLSTTGITQYGIEMVEDIHSLDRPNPSRKSDLSDFSEIYRSPRTTVKNNIEMDIVYENWGQGARMKYVEAFNNTDITEMCAFMRMVSI